MYKNKEKREIDVIKDMLVTLQVSNIARNISL